VALAGTCATNTTATATEQTQRKRTPTSDSPRRASVLRVASVARRSIDEISRHVKETGVDAVSKGLISKVVPRPPHSRPI